MIGTDDLLCCFFAGSFMNWDGAYLDETLSRHDEVNSSIDFVLNLLGFGYIGMVMPWSEFHDPEGTGLTIPLLIGLLVMVLLFRRLPSIFMLFKFIKAIDSWKDALFVGYFGPIGIGAVFYVEHSLHLFPHHGEEGATEETELLLRKIRPGTVCYVHTGAPADI
jgi:NhaP-type Na+/H+ or K+/H+ antiporter